MTRPADRRANLLAAKIGDRLRRQGGDLLLAHVQRGEFLPRKVELYLRLHEDRLGFQEQLLGGDLLFEKSLLALKEHVLKIEIRQRGEIFALRLRHFARVDDRNGFAARDAVAQTLAQFFDDARDLRGDPRDFVGIGLDRAGRREPTRNVAWADWID